MEDEDFGFTKREESLLKKVLRSGEARERPLNADEAPTGEGAGAAQGGGSVGSSPETGNEEELRGASDRERTSVGRGTPDIPNVVEYHLKIQPKSHNKGPNSEKTDDSLESQEGKSRTKMRTEGQTTLVTPRDERKPLSSALSRLSIDNNVFEGSTNLPQVFQVKYLGSHDARGLWGIKHTRKPVDNMVAAAKSLPPDTILPLVKLVVAEEGVSLVPIGKRKSDTGVSKSYAIESISYGVQDLVYTRVFSMIVVRNNGNFRRVSPFECHAFVCESKHHARQLTYALATAFQIYSQNVKGKLEERKKRFAIDLRSPEEIETDLTLDSEA